MLKNKIYKGARFSVLMSVYFKDVPSFLDAALNSILHQSVMPAEIVLVKDGKLSSELEMVIDCFSDKYSCLKIINLESNMGLGEALSVGLRHCSYEYVARMDSDDISVYNRFEVQVEFLNTNSDFALVGGNIEEFDKLPGDLKQFRNLPETHAEIMRIAKFRSPVNHPTIMFRKSQVLECGGYNNDILLWEDYALFVRMLNAGLKFYNLQTVVLHFRIGDGYKMIKRRSGMRYALNEIKFATYAKKIGFFSVTDYLKYILIKPPARILPARILFFIYKKFFRSKKK